MNGAIRGEATLSKALPIPGEAWQSDPERLVVDSAKNGSDDAFEQLVTRYYSRLFRVAYKITRHYQDAEDILQSALFNAFNKLPQFRGDSRFYTWLVSITVNEALMRIRRRRSNHPLIDESRELDDTATADFALQALEPNPEEYSSHSELRTILGTAINKLRPEYRQVYQLRYADGLSIHEIAEACTLSLSAVKTRLHRARTMLQRSLKRFVRPRDGHNPAYAGAVRTFRPRDPSDVQTKYSAPTYTVIMTGMEATDRSSATN